LLELNGLEEVNKYSPLVSSSLLVVKLTSVERRDSAFLGALLTACSIFRLQLPFECINFFEKNKEGQRLLSGSSFGFKASLFLLFKFGDCSAIRRVVVVLVTIMTSHVGPLWFLEDLPTLLVTEILFLLSTGIEEGLGPLLRLIFSKFSKCLK
jgi:hypothetical protein